MVLAAARNSGTTVFRAGRNSEQKSLFRSLTGFRPRPREVSGPRFISRTDIRIHKGILILKSLAFGQRMTGPRYRKPSMRR